MKLSNLSNIPPCPGSIRPESLTPKWRLNPDSTKSPNWPNILKKIGEDAKVSIRNIRRDINDQLKKDEKNGDITEDDLRSQTDDVQKATDNSIKEIDQLVADKEKDIMSV